MPRTASGGAALTAPGSATNRGDADLAPRLDLVEQLHGRSVPDPYRWLEDPTDDRTTAWSAAQAQRFAEAASAWSTAEHWRSRLTELLGSGGVSPPIWRGEHYFEMRRDPAQEHAVLRRVAADGASRVLIDPMELDPDGLTTLDSWQPSKEGNLLAYQLSVGGSEESAVYVMDVETGETLDGPIDRARYSPIAWLPGEREFYYVRRLPPDAVPEGEEQYHRRVWLHRVGDDADQDLMIFGEGRKSTDYFGVSVSRDGRWLSISASEGTAPRNDLWISDLNSNDPSQPVMTEVQVGVDAQTGLHFGRDGRVYVFTDRDAPRGRLCVTSPDALDFASWRDLIPQDEEAVLDGFAILDGDQLDTPVLLTSWTRHAVAELKRHDLATGDYEHDIELPGIGTIGGIVERPDGGSDAFFAYTDYVSAGTVYRYEATDDSLGVWALPPGTVNVPPVSSSIHVYRSPDGTEVRMFVVAPVNAVAPDGQPTKPRPTVLYGYGGFGIPMAPAYSASILAWVEAGGVYAIACIRGGGEEGEEWHRGGMLANKQNVYDDFIAGAQWLIAQGWTSTEQLAISGGSNGGLLVGAAMTQRPDLFAGVHCSAPLLDMIRYETSGLGATWNVEYGTAAQAEEFEWLWGYSPYHHTREGIDYPSTLFTVFEGDSRVDPMHARKLCAALTHATSGTRPILIRAEADVGHGARSLTRSVDLATDTLAFLAEATGLELSHNETPLKIAVAPGVGGPTMREANSE